MINKSFYNKKIELISLEEIANKYEIKLIGRDNNIANINNIVNAKEGELTFVTNLNYLQNLETTKATACIISQEYLEKALALNENISYLVSNEAYNLLGKILKLFYIEKNSQTGISATAHIAESATIGNNVNIGHNSYIAENVKIGDNVTIFPSSYIGDGVEIDDNSVIGANSSICFTYIGKNVEILGGCQIGQDGFGYAKDGNKFSKIIQLGTVTIEDNVSIGANVCIDRGSLENTIIGAGTKIDNLVQIAHNVQIGKNCLIAAQTGIAGSTKLGDYVVFGGQVGVAGHLHIGSFNRFAAQSGVTKNIAQNSGDLYGMPAQAKKDWQKEQIAIRKLTKEYFKND